MRRARTLSEFHYNRVFIDATALASEARLHAELRFKLGLPSDYAANWDALRDDAVENRVWMEFTVDPNG